jgi:hypothetical protein
MCEHGSFIGHSGAYLSTYWSRYRSVYLNLPIVDFETMSPMFIPGRKVCRCRSDTIFENERRSHTFVYSRRGIYLISLLWYISL